ncbi:MAG TPA: hypothetical protein VLG48_07425 [Candidatus Methylomirabilis sp.]|nr:hypothetical protein [Candidatus Methylomirabilis sp.]
MTRISGNCPACFLPTDAHSSLQSEEGTSCDGTFKAIAQVARELERHLHPEALMKVRRALRHLQTFFARIHW